MASTIWKGYLTFGLLSLPVKLYSAARSETVSFNQLHKADSSRVKQVLYCQAEDKPIQRSEIVNGPEGAQPHAPGCLEANRVGHADKRRFRTGAVLCWRRCCRETAADGQGG